MPFRRRPLLRSSVWKVAWATFLITLLPTAETRGESVQLGWTAPGDDGDVGRAAAYELRYSLSPIANLDTLSWWGAATSVGSMPAPQAAGNRESFTIAGLDSGMTYYFVIRTTDDASNVSGFSNVAVRQAGSAGGGTPGVEAAEVHGYPNPARGMVTFRYQGGAPGRVQIVVYDLTGRRIRRLLDDIVPPGEHTMIWNCRTDGGLPVAPGLYNVILDGPAGRKVTRLAIVP